MKYPLLTRTLLITPITFAAAVFVSQSSSGCGDGSGEGICKGCNGPKSTWICFANGEPAEEMGHLCTSESDEGEIIILCNAKFAPATNQVNLAPCDNSAQGGTAGAGESDCSGWDPDAAITLVSGVYEIDQSFVDDVLADPLLIPNCDGSKLDQVATGWLVTAGSSGDLFYELGLRDDDTIEEVNGDSVATFDEVAAVFALYIDGETEFEIAFDRNGTPTTIDIEFVP